MAKAAGQFTHIHRGASAVRVEPGENRGEVIVTYDDGGTVRMTELLFEQTFRPIKRDWLDGLTAAETPAAASSSRWFRRRSSG